jgi:hypothetical protein
VGVCDDEAEAGAHSTLESSSSHSTLEKLLFQN